MNPPQDWKTPGGWRAPLARPHQSLAKRRRWESNPLQAALQAAAVPSGSSAALSSVLARSRAWSSTFARSRANPSHSEDMFLIECPAEESNLVRQFRGLPCSSGTPAGQHDQVARPGIEPGPTASEAGVRSGTLTGHNISIPTWSRTRTRALGEPRAIRYTIGTN